MVEAIDMNFGQRLRKIDQNHRKLAQGYVASMNEDGLVVAQPRKQSRGGATRGVFFCLLLLLAFKGVLLSQMGEVAYGEKVTQLSNGTMLEKAGSYAMAADPLTVLIANQIGNFTK